MNLGEMIERSALRYAQNIAVVCGDKRITYEELNNSVNKLANGLTNLGLEKRDKIALLLPNCEEFIISYFALNKIGATVVPLNWGYKKDEIGYIFKDAGIKAAIVTSRLRPTIEEIKKELPGLERIIIGKDESKESLTNIMKGQSSSFFLPQVDPEDIASLIYTSAFNGYPRGAMLSHRSLIWDTQACVKVISGTQQDKYLGVLPFFHAFGATASMLLPMLTGASTYLLEKFLPDKVLEIITKERITIFTGVPTMFKVLADLGENIPADLTSLRACISGGAKLDEEILRKFEGLFKINLLEGYGITECSPVVFLNYPPEKRKINSIGFPFPGMEAKIFDENEKELPAGEEGEIVIRGDNVMKGYYNRKEESEKALRGGWFHTGDLGKVDEEGYFFVTGHKKRMLIMAGFNVYPQEVENVLMRHPKIKEAEVVGVPDPLYGEIPKAYITLKEGEELSPEEVIKYCREHLANYKVPRVIEIGRGKRKED